MEYQNKILASLVHPSMSLKSLKAFGTGTTAVLTAFASPGIIIFVATRQRHKSHQQAHQRYNLDLFHLSRKFQIKTILQTK
jgi:hypothetical protein